MTTNVVNSEIMTLLLFLSRQSTGFWVRKDVETRSNDYLPVKRACGSSLGAEYAPGVSDRAFASMPIVSATK